MSFLRHADLSPDGHPAPTHLHQGKDRICPSLSVTHRYDESGRVFLAGCSPAVEYQTDGLDKKVRNSFRDLDLLAIFETPERRQLRPRAHWCFH